VTLATQNNFLYTLLDFTLGGQRFTLVNDTAELISNGVTYSPSAFKADLLEQPGKGLGTTNIIFSNVSADGEPLSLGEIVFNNIQAIMGEMIILRRVLRSNADNVLIDMPLEVLGVIITPKELRINVGFYNLYQQTLPRLYYDNRTAPGLV